MRWVILRTVSGFLLPFLILFSLFLLVRGHTSPGGGFIAGVMGGLSLALFAITFGYGRSPRPVYLIASGLFISALTGVVSMILGFPFLKSKVLHAEMPFFGAIHIPTSLFFDIGIAIAVVGAILLIIETIGGGE